MLGAKQLDFLDFCKAAEIIASKGHLTIEGATKLDILKSGMNDSRKILNPITTVSKQKKEELRIVPYEKKNLAIIKYKPTPKPVLPLALSLNSFDTPSPSISKNTGPVVDYATILNLFKLYSDICNKYIDKNFNIFSIFILYVLPVLGNKALLGLLFIIYIMFSNYQIILSQMTYVEIIEILGILLTILISLFSINRTVHSDCNCGDSQCRCNEDKTSCEPNCNCPVCIDDKDRRAEPLNKDRDAEVDWVAYERKTTEKLTNILKELNLDIIEARVKASVDHINSTLPAHKQMSEAVKLDLIEDLQETYELNGDDLSFIQKSVDYKGASERDKFFEKPSLSQADRDKIESKLSNLQDENDDKLHARVHQKVCEKYAEIDRERKV